MTHSTWDSLFLCRSLVTLSQLNDYGIIEDGAIAVKNNSIAWVGKRQELQMPYEKLADVINDYSNYCLTPGLIDCHTHLIYGGHRAYEFEQRLQGKSYADIAKEGGGIMSTVRATRLATSQQLFENAKKRLANWQREGVTTVEIKSGYGLDKTTEIELLTIAKKLEQHFPITIYPTFLGAHALPPEYDSSDAYVQFICEEMIPLISERHLAKAVDVFCESIGFNLQQTEKVFATAAHYGLGIKCHAEQLSNMGASQLAAKYHALSVDHVEFISESDINAIAQSGTVAVLLPGAFYNLREKHHPPIDIFRQHQIPMAVATDCNPGTSPVCSLLLMINMACVLFRLTPLEALMGVTRHAARALGSDATLGSLEIGKLADFALWDIEHPRELAYYAGYNSCVGVVKRGEVVNL